MKRSTDRILTTHTGSLPRANDLTLLLEALDAGTIPEQAAFDARVRRAVGDIVRQQVDAGVDVVNDGEQGKVGYSTYVRHRLTGFGGQAAVPTRADWSDFPEAAAKSERRSTTMRPSSNGRSDWKDRTAVQKDLANLTAAVSSAKPTETFMTAASPGVIAHFLKNEHYPSREAYLARLVDVMKEEYDAIHRAGFILQVDCPDLAMGRHLAFPDLSNAEFLKIAAANVEALNHALRDIPPDRMRLHLCWGNYEGPHHRDIPLKEILPIALKSRPQARHAATVASCAREGTPAVSWAWKCARDSQRSGGRASRARGGQGRAGRLPARCLASACADARTRRARTPSLRGAWLALGSGW